MRALPARNAGNERYKLNYASIILRTVKGLLISIAECVDLELQQLR